MTTADPHLAQRRASDPGASIFVTANAGSGKTTTLVDRVARLLLGGAQPQAILCVTYTKAAAAEMQRRLFDRLGDWSVMVDEALRTQLQQLDGRPEAPAEDLSKARALFARALETPGGLKIQTIHAFCEKLLRRFPLEAAVSPGFQVMDDAQAAEIGARARADVARHALGGDGAVAQAYARMAVAMAFDDFQEMFTAFEDRRAALGAYIARCGGLAGAQGDVWARCGFEAPVSTEAIERAAVAPDALDARLWRACAAALLDGGGKSDAKAAAQMIAVAEAVDAGAGDFTNALAALFTAGGDKGPAAWVAKTAALKPREDLRAALLGEQHRLALAREARRAARVAEDTVYALILAQAYIEAYAHEKRAAGALDFADLILKTCALLTARADAAWVLYKLDGGIDHILVDEAQDTAPEQWDILRALTGEFFVGAGVARLRAALERTLFVVGDEKQSIYSFQGADPDRLRIETAGYHEMILAAGRRAELTPLIASFRSTPEVLAFVDGVFADPQAWAGVPPPRGQSVLRHLAMRQGHEGCVDLWPLEREAPGDEREAWDEPLDEPGVQSANRRLAERIAGEIKALVERGDAVFDRHQRRFRPAGYGDVLILVRRRGVLFEEILRALKRLGAPVAGADRLRLSQHIVFDDLMALMRFIQFPRDDLTLAALLKSPLCGLNEQALFDLAHGRGELALWTVLAERSAERPEWAAAWAFLEGARAEAGARRPFDLFARLLGWTDASGLSARARILTRLGSEAQDVLDEFLAQVLAAERAGVSDVEQLAAAFAGLDITVKREMDGARAEVRVMTVHGSKGLEAPIVFLPETAPTRAGRGSALLRTEPAPGDPGGFLWASSGLQDCADSAAARAWRQRREDEEAQRLFYVALTRARDRLILCGRINAKTAVEGIGGWYGAAEAAFAQPGIADQVRLIRDAGMEVRRFGPDPSRLEPETLSGAAEPDAPPWLFEAAPAERAARYASPSGLGDEAEDAAPAPSPLARTGGLGRFRRGDLIHRLLQVLPDLAVEARAGAAARLLARERDLNDAQRAEMAAAALGVLNDPQFAAVFGPGSRAEVALAGALAGLGAMDGVSGRVDRLLVEGDRVLVIDFKTNRPAPATIEAADPAYLRQMAVYVALLGAIFPGRRIDAALVWTDGPRLMPIPEILTARTLARMTGSVDT